MCAACIKNYRPIQCALCDRCWIDPRPFAPGEPPNDRCLYGGPYDAQGRLIRRVQ